MGVSPEADCDPVRYRNKRLSTPEKQKESLFVEGEGRGDGAAESEGAAAAGSQLSPARGREPTETPGAGDGRPWGAQR